MYHIGTSLLVEILFAEIKKNKHNFRTIDSFATLRIEILKITKTLIKM